ncbi:ImpA family metalloprotease [Microbulbifer sp. SAOS-129_SWC]|uniref:ImpA family metalloprotease n=1 Tax=Microbulbifer sp. SAOS-129_SWC TaxID=3145235 RepID=UPI003216B020
MITSYLKKSFFVFMFIALAGCGGGGGSSDSSSGDSGTTPGDNSSGSSAPVSVELPAELNLYNDQALSLSGTVSGDGTLSYQWQQLSGKPVTFSTGEAANTEVRYPPSMATETYEFSLTASNSASSDTATVHVTIHDRIDDAVTAGDPALLPATASALEQRILDRVAERQQTIAAFDTEIFAGHPIDFDPSRNSRFFFLDSMSDAIAAIIGNGGKTFATATDNGGYRTVALGDNVIVKLDNGQQAGFAQPMVKLLDWLLTPRNASLSGGGAVQVALMQMSSGNMNDTENWLQAQDSGVAITRCTVEAELGSCLSGADLVITGAADTSMAESAVTAALAQAVGNQQSLLYVHTNSWNSTALTNPILKFFAVQTQAPGSAGNYFAQDAASWSSAEEMRSANSTLSRVAALVARFKDNSFSFQIAQCQDEDNNCSNVPAYASEFSAITADLQGIPQRFDAQAQDIFASSGNYRLEKLLLLLADKYRETVTFPMWKDVTPTVDFLKSYFADSLTYTSRAHNPAQPDLGNFSRSDFSHVTPMDKTVQLTSRRNFRAAGAYALPGQTFSVTRTDSNSAADATVFINTQRSSATRHMYPSSSNAPWGYVRPKFLQSSHIPIKAGETRVLTSPYGGPIEIGFTDTGSDMTFEFHQVGQHPFWRSGDDAAAFMSALTANNYDWAEIATEHFEIHSKRDKLLDTLAKDSRWDTPSEFERYLTRYHHNYLRVLAGFQGEDIDTVPEVSDFAASHGLALAVWDKVQHGTMDQSACGAGCSGNPYDATWSFSILGHGDLHEVGHTVESGRFKFNGFEGHATTNFYSYYAKSRAQDEDGVVQNCQKLPFDTINNDISDSQSQADPGAYMASRGYSTWNYGAALVIDMMMHAEERGALSDGWDLIPRLHVLQRGFDAARGNDADWDAGKGELGFSGYTRTQANTIDNNDWLLIATSYATGLDYRPYFDLIGQPYSAEANAQVAGFGYPAVDHAFYLPASNQSYCDTLAGHTEEIY